MSIRCCTAPGKLTPDGRCQKCLRALQLRHCSGCSETKALELFYSPDSRCKVCVKARTKLWAASNPEKVKARPPQNKPAYQREYSLKHRFGMTQDDYENLSVAQGMRCAICQGPPTRKHFSIDHCHKTGKVRGLLCQPCNAGLGHFKDSLSVVRSAGSYLAASLGSSHVDEPPPAGRREEPDLQIQEHVNAPGSVPVPPHTSEL